MPQSPKDWKLIAEEFEEKWNYPTVLVRLMGNMSILENRHNLVHFTTTIKIHLALF